MGQIPELIAYVYHSNCESGQESKDYTQHAENNNDIMGINQFDDLYALCDAVFNMDETRFILSGGAHTGQK